MIYDHTYFPSKLRQFREAKTLTQEQLANACGWPAALISHYECGNRFPGIINFVKLCNALDVEPHNLFTR